MVLSRLTLGLGLALAGFFFIANPVMAEDKGGDNEGRAKRFIAQYEATVRPLEIDMYRSQWAALISGKDADYEKKQAAEEKWSLVLSNPEHFAELKAIKEAGLSDPLLRRQIDVMHLIYLEKQVPAELLKKMLVKSNAVERTFSVSRPKVDGKELTDNEVRRILRESHDSAQRRAVWEASKAVGRANIENLKELVTLRNESARRLGFSDFFAMRLYLNEQNEQQLFKLLDEIDELTRGPFHEAKAEMDTVLAGNCGITAAELRPWHYHDPFFQEPPAVSGELPESVYKALNTVETVRKFYEGIGLPIDDVIQRSDLFEKPGKNPHAMCQDTDREGDVRVLENIVPGREWMGTTLHEMGHAVYSKNLPRTLPYVLRIESHTLSTEGVAMMFERFAQNVDWLRAMGGNVTDPEKFQAAAAKLRRNRVLIFSRWCQVMARFERELYRNPDQDLNRLWWSLVEKYQELKCPEGRNEPDFAAKYHIIGAPVYYHNYLMGELFASQMHHALVRAVLPPGTNPAGAIYVGNKAAGEFMKQTVFAPGLTLNWNELARHVSGEDLSPKALAEDLGIAK